MLNYNYTVSGNMQCFFGGGGEGEEMDSDGGSGKFPWSRINLCMHKILH